ncbi:uncharacterized protein ACNS7B_021033 [Menidia menidia]
MVVNSSSSWNVSLSTQQHFTSHMIYSHLYNCFSSRDGAYVITAFVLISIIVIFPVCVYILHLCHKQWWRKQSRGRINHSDLLTYNMAIIDLINIFGCVLCCCGTLANIRLLLLLSTPFFPFSYSGQVSLHTLTCVERYLAVVHPITYLSLKSADGIRIRNATIACIWLTCFATIGCLAMTHSVFKIVITFVCMPVVLMVISFCSISVLCTLIHPVPGKENRDRLRVDRSKLRAFWTIVIILGVLVLRFGGHIFISALFDAMKVKNTERCGVWFLNLGVCLPCSLVLPLLFLHRAGKLRR